ncbi:hypothetical protein SADO_14639 [Salinisphaera dokdonensis CL-ES53]|uniref:Uncharacterized protein n=2 Tax=Salinisphaera TaxID=180541 RepID=A0ABV2B3N7_9GAMM
MRGYRREAKLLARADVLSHSKALDALARRDGFKNWSEINFIRRASEAAEQTLAEGFVIAMDVKEALEFEKSKGFLEDQLMWHLVCLKLVEEYLAEKRASPSPAVFYEDPDLKGEWQESDFDQDNAFESIGGNTTVFAYSGRTPVLTPEAASFLLCDICFWRPEQMWFKGQRYDGQWINDQVYGPPPAVSYETVEVSRTGYD